ncbi:Cullin family-domain-containing protein [Mycena olivaceomarginata]|nr:Cullin family-domain-containing protein [Mycena olivaceomarginata]
MAEVILQVTGHRNKNRDFGSSILDRGPWESIGPGPRSRPHSTLLWYYAAGWDRYTTGANYLNRLFTYLNHYWVKRERDEDKKAVCQVYTLALASWRKHLFDTLQAPLTTAILRLVAAQRDSASIDQALFVALSLDATDPNKECLGLYKELREERVVRYLHAKTRKELVGTCEGVLLRRMWDAFQAPLDFDAGEDLQRMYALRACIPEGLEPLRKKFEAHIKAGIVAALVRGSDSASAAAKDKDNDGAAKGKAAAEGDVEGKTCVDALLAVHENTATVTRSFKGAAAGFAAALDKACREFVNRNAATGTSAAKSPELLAKHADMLSRKMLIWSAESSGMSALLFPPLLSRTPCPLSRFTMVLFKCLDDKDVFRTFYMTRLSKRLIHGVSASDEAEASMISKLKEACGFEYTNALQRMSTGGYVPLEGPEDSFKERTTQNHDDMDIAFSIMVLGTNFSLPAPPTHDFLLPPELLPRSSASRGITRPRFAPRDLSHSGCKLAWLYNYSKDELRTNYTNRKYILMTSAYQAAVLLQYNRNDTLSPQELQEATKISAEILGQVLALLVKAKVLVNDEKDQYDLNLGARRRSVNLNLPIKAEVKAESSDVLKLKAVDEDRKYVIQPTIVRIMNARKTMKNQVLIQEVISQISQRFAPKIPDIKTAIETFLEKEYMERVDGSKDTSAYGA